MILERSYSLDPNLWFIISKAKNSFHLVKSGEDFKLHARTPCLWRQGKCTVSAYVWFAQPFPHVMLTARPNAILKAGKSYLELRQILCNPFAYRKSTFGRNVSVNLRYFLCTY